MTNAHLSFIATSNNSKPGVSNPQVALEPFEQPYICVVTTLKEYLVRAKALRGSGQSQLLLSYVEPYKPVSRDTVTRCFSWY